MMNNKTGLEIAVIGMAGRFPGAKTVPELWQSLKQGKETVSFYSKEELASLAVDPRLLRDPGYVTAVSFLEDVECFDASFFGYTPREAELMAPQMRIFHECAYRALEDAGYVSQAYDWPIGLYAGGSTSAHWESLAFFSGKRDALGDLAANLLVDKDQLCTRISYNLNMKGPSFSIATACSTSLVAIHLACQGLLSGECKMALAGGVTVLIPRNYGYLFQEGGILSSDGHCRAFDSKADGSVIGEGAGVVVLKSLEDALTDGDFIYAIIKGSAINNDGSGKVGYTAPGVKGQAAVIRAALHAAEVEAETIGYIETHGTGTKMGDNIEIQALKSAFNTKRKGFCRIGSVKSNLGHLVHAAGVTGFIKTVLSIHHKLIPPTINFETANPEFDFENSPFIVNNEPLEWKRNAHPLRAGVSAFGIGGTNAHVILEEWPESTLKNKTQIKSFDQTFSKVWPPAGAHHVDGGLGPEAGVSRNDGVDSAVPKLILLSAKTKPALDKMTTNLADYFKTNPGIDAADAAYTLQLGRMAYPYRRFTVCSGVEEAAEVLLGGSSMVKTGFVKEEKRTVVFMFAGLGSQYVNMGLGLYETIPLFRREMDRCFDIAAPLLGYDLKEILYPSLIPGRTVETQNLASQPLDGPASGGQGGAFRENCPPNEAKRSAFTLNSHFNLCEIPPEKAFDINSFEVAQLAVFILEYALAKLLLAWGIRPHLMIGYSFGEYTAASISGVLSLQEALELIVIRGRLISDLPTGLMLSVPLPAEEVEPFLNEKISISIDNGPSCIVSGPVDELENLENSLKCKRYLCMRLPNSHAIHSRMMGPVLKDFEAQVRRFKLNKPGIPYISNVTGKRISDEEAVNPLYWCRHMRETVRFASGIDRLRQETNPIFIEIGAGRDLSTLSVRHKEGNPGLQAINLIRPGQQETDDNSYLMGKIGRLWLFGIAVDWRQFYHGENRFRLPLPGYPFDRKAFWIDGASLRNIGAGKSLANPLPRKRREEESDHEDAAGLNQRPGELNSEYRPPTSDLEQKLAALWQELFGIDPIGIDDDFFELGGDSLLATTMVSRLQREIGIPLPVVEVFNLLTIGKIAAYVRDNKSILGEKIGENLVFLKGSARDDAPYFFCIHDISGDVEGYIEFCNRLETGFNFWGLKACRIKDYTPIELTVQDLAEKYLEAIRSLQPHGPYYLTGWSFGGFVAYEMVRLLEKQGEEVSFFAAVDAFIFRDELIDTSLDFSLASELNRLGEFLPAAPGLEEKLAHVTAVDQLWPLVVEYLQGGEFGTDALKKILPENMSLIVPDFDRLTPGELILSLNMLRTFNRALNVYEPSGKIRAAVHFFKAERLIWEVPPHHWETCSSKGVTFYNVPGDHFSIFRRPGVTRLAKKFENPLSEAIGFFLASGGPAGGQTFGKV